MTKNKEILNKNKVLTIDPSRTGSSILSLTDGAICKSTQFYSSDWKEHLKFIVNFVKENQPTQVIYEKVNQVHNRSVSAINLSKLLKAIEIELEHVGK